MEPGDLIDPMFLPESPAASLSSIPALDGPPSHFSEVYPGVNTATVGTNIIVINYMDGVYNIVGNQVGFYLPLSIVDDQERTYQLADARMTAIYDTDSHVPFAFNPGNNPNLTLVLQSHTSPTVKVFGTVTYIR
jgi:hypothetical protein